MEEEDHSPQDLAGQVADANDRLKQEADLDYPMENHLEMPGFPRGWDEGM